MSPQGLYADDTAVAYQSRKPEHVIIKLKENFNNIEHWCKVWKIKINADKSSLLIVRRHKPQAAVNNILTFLVTICRLLTKYLGVTINSKLNWSYHATNTLNKARKAYYALRPLRPGLKTKPSKQKDHISYVLPPYYHVCLSYLGYIT